MINFSLNTCWRLIPTKKQEDSINMVLSFFMLPNPSRGEGKCLYGGMCGFFSDGVS